MSEERSPSLNGPVDYRIRLNQFSKRNYRVLESHPSGVPEKIKLLRTDPIPGTKFKWGSVLNFDPEGRLRKVLIRYAAEFQGVTCSSIRAPIKFHPNGRLKACSLDEAWRQNGLIGFEYSIIRFHPNGRLKEIHNTDPMKTQRWPEGKLLFDEQGHRIRRSKKNAERA